MNYQAHYDRLIERAKYREPVGYIEKHHIIPKCMGGSNDKSNLVKLYAEEHFVAHQLLVKIYPGENGLIFAVHAMVWFNSKVKRNNKLYSWLAKQRSISCSKIHKGKILSDETKNKLRIANAGKKLLLKLKNE